MTRRLVKEERQLRMFAALFSGNGPIAFTRPAAGRAAPSTPTADPPAQQCPSSGLRTGRGGYQ
jgi:hypothetical protein